MNLEEKIVMSYQGTVEEWADMLKINEYKRALNDIKVSLESLDKETENLLVLGQEFEIFVRKELPEILVDLNLD
jgi:hypothetical protein